MTFVLLGLKNILIHGVLVSYKQVKQVTTLPGSNKWTQNVADCILVGPLAPFAVLIVLIGKVLPNNAS